MKGFLFFLLAASLQYCSGTHVPDPMCEHEGQEHYACHEFYMSRSETETFSKLMETTGPNAEALATYCPYLKNYLNCTKSFAEICPHTFYTASYSQISRVYDIVLELCDVHSRLHQAYIRNFDCVFGLKDHFKLCEGSAQNQKSLYEQHYEFDNKASEEEFDYEVHHESLCLFRHLMIGCFFTMTEETCGEDARDTLFEIAMRGKDPCIDVDFEDLEKKYLTVMNIADPDSPDNRLRMFRNRTEGA